MRIHSFEQMQEAYEPRGLDDDDISSRKEMLTTHPFNVIVEAGLLELDSLNKWIPMNISPDPLQWIFYGKIAYDFGFAEYFFAIEGQAKAVEAVIPHIYTIYPHSLQPRQAVKSNWYDEDIAYDPNDQHGIVFGPIEK